MRRLQLVRSCNSESPSRGDSFLTNSLHFCANVHEKGMHSKTTGLRRSLIINDAHARLSHHAYHSFAVAVALNNGMFLVYTASGRRYHAAHQEQGVEIVSCPPTTQCVCSLRSQVMRQPLIDVRHLIVNHTARGPNLNKTLKGRSY